MRVFKAEYFDAWTFVPFLTLCSMLTCLNQFLNSVYVVYKLSLIHIYKSRGAF